MSPGARNIGDGPIPASPSGASFTPGPWLIHAERRWIVPAEDTFKAPADALPICQLRDPDERFTEDETLANGFLIAAAPELYATLEHVREMLVAYGPRYIEKASALADAALAKARGEAA